MQANTLQAALAEALSADPGDDRIVCSTVGPVLWLRIERSAQHNALALSMLDTIGTRLQAAARVLKTHPDAVRLAVITGAGDQSFAAGGDLKELDAVRSEAQAQAMTERGMRALDAIRDFPQPVLAGLNGSARGGGAELALACDWRVAHEQAQIGLIQGQLALSTAWGGGTDLFAQLGRGAALKLLAEARLLEASEAVRLGLLDGCIAAAAAEFPAALEAYVERLARQPSQVLRAHKRLANRYSAALRRLCQEEESAQLVRTWTHEDHWQRAARALRSS
ncbi:MAG: enoyl-CoA hydratase/isomerase family protein [Pseudomonadota bacterium]